MRRNDDADVIAALAAGLLDPDRAAEAEAAILADPAATRELAAQRAALKAIRDAAPVMMSSEERSALRSRVAHGLGMESTEAAAPTVRRAPSRLAAIAVPTTALIAVLVIVPLVGMLSTGGVRFDFDATALRSAEQARGDPTDAFDDAGSILSVAGDGEPDVIGFGPDPESPPGTIVVDTTAEEIDTTTTEAVAGSPEIAEADLAKELELERSLDSGGFVSATPADGETACADEALTQFFEGAGDPSALYVIEYETSEHRLVIVFFERDAGSGQIHSVTAFDPESCLVVAAAP